MKTQISIIIPTHNRFDLTERLLRSIEEKTKHSYRLILVDDCSDKETQEQLYTYCQGKKNAHYLRMNFRGGYTKAVNNGIRCSIADMYVLLNNDTIIGTEGWLNNIVKCRKQTKCGVMSPLSNKALAQSLPFVEGEDTIEEMSKWLEENTERRYPIHYLPHGFCYIITDETIKRVGYFNDIQYSSYGCEDDYSIRCHMNNVDTRVVDDVFIYHDSAASYNQEFKNKATTEATVKIFGQYGRDKFLQMAKFVGIDYLKEKKVLKKKHQALTYIIPMCNMEEEKYGERQANIQAIVDYMIKDRDNVELLLVEQQLSKGMRLLVDGIDVYNTTHRIEKKVNQQFCKGWLQNIAVKQVNTNYFILGETDTISFNVDYFYDVCKFIEANNIPWCIGWNNIFYTTEEDTIQMRKTGEAIRRGSICRPSPGGSEGGMVFISKDTWSLIGGADETYRWLGGPDNELAYRLHKATGQYQMCNQDIYHLYHSPCVYKTNEQVSINRRRYGELIERDNWRIVCNCLRQHKLGGYKPRDIIYETFTHK